MRKMIVAKILVKKTKTFVPVVYGRDFFVEYRTNNIPYKITIPTFPQSDDLYYEQYTQELLKKHNLSASYFIMSILHEIGHTKEPIKNWKQYSDDKVTLVTLLKEGVFSEKEYAYAYCQLPNEFQADEWAINWIKNNQKLVKVLDSFLN